MTRPGPFRVVVADPPWRFGDRLPGPGRGAAKHYRVLGLDEIAAFPLPPIAPDAYLFLWRVAAMQEEALAVCRAWGFTVKAEIIWRKLTATGRPWFGMGRHVRASHEVCLVATRGRPRRLNASTRSVFDAPAGRHSEKPAAFLDLVERFAPGPYLEVFARRRRPGWSAIGDELPKARR